MIRYAFIVLLSMLSSFPITSMGHEAGRVRVKDHRFSIVKPAESTAAKMRAGIIEFTGGPATYEPGARFFLSSIKGLSMPPAQLKAFMKRSDVGQMFQRILMNSTGWPFPDIRSLRNGFVYLNKRPAVDGSFVFSADKKQMQGRYVIVLVEEQSSVYTFTWTSGLGYFKKWDKASRRSTESLHTLRTMKRIS